MDRNKPTQPKKRKMRLDLIKERNEQIRKEYYETFGKMTVEELAKKYNMSKTNLYYILRQEEE